MDEKKNLRRLLGYLGICLTAGLAFVFVVDPFYQYHKPWFNIPIVLEDAVYQTAGAARNLEYDSAIVGTSMTENLHTSWFDEELGWDTMKLSYSGARSNDLQAIFEQISGREEELKNVVMDINDYQLTCESWTKYVERPEYLYDTYIHNDYKYLFNCDVYVRCAQRCVDGLKRVQDNVDNAYTWEDAELFCGSRAREASKDLREQLLAEKTGCEFREQPYQVAGSLSDEFGNKLTVCQDNLDNILPFIANHPDTQFHILIPPYSMLYWEQKVLSDNLEDTFGIYGYAIQAFLAYENVTVYYFQYEPEIIANLDNYRDSTHHRPEYNKYMFECIRDGKNILTRENYEDVLTTMYEYAREFPYVTLWEG